MATIIDNIQDIIAAFLQFNFTELTDTYATSIIYLIMFAILILENGFLPAFFLPGDSLLLLAGALIGKGVIEFAPTVMILTIAASLGCWLSYLQGRWLSNTNMFKDWLAQLPYKYHQRTTNMFDRHGLLALFAGRFLVLVRTLLPIIAGISGFSNRHFLIFNWLSAFLWVAVITSLGYILNIVPLIKHYEDLFITFLILLPIILTITGLAVAIMAAIKKKYCNE